METRLDVVKSLLKYPIDQEHERAGILNFILFRSPNMAVSGTTWPSNQHENRVTEEWPR
jgi:hypothetical protein